MGKTSITHTAPRGLNLIHPYIHTSSVMRPLSNHSEFITTERRSERWKWVLCFHSWALTARQGTKRMTSKLDTSDSFFATPGLLHLFWAKESDFVIKYKDFSNCSCLSAHGGGWIRYNGFTIRQNRHLKRWGRQSRHHPRSRKELQHFLSNLISPTNRHTRSTMYNSREVRKNVCSVIYMCNFHCC